MKKIITTFGMIIVVLVSLSIEVFAFFSEAGFCGDKLEWTLVSGGTLVISGTGYMDNYSIASPAPWYEFKDEVEVEDVVIRDNVTSIGDYAFYDCTKLQSIDIPINIATVEKGAFYGCSNLQISVNADNPNFSSVGGVLYNKEETTLCVYAKNASTYTVPDATTVIALYAFADNTALTTITLPNTITEIGENAFEDCTKLNKIVFNGTAAEWDSINIDASNADLEEKVIFPDRVYISGESSIEVGATSTTQAVTYSSPADLEYFICTIKYPSCFKLTGYTPVDFEYVSKDTEKDGGEYTTVTFTCQYSGNALAPSDTTLTVTANTGIIYGNDNLMLSGLPQSFSLTGDSTEIEFDIKGVSDFEDGAYTVRVLREVQSELTPLDEYKDKLTIQKIETTDTITLTIEPTVDIDLSNMSLYVAEYDGGALSSVWRGENSVVDGKLVIAADKSSAADYKIMFWDGMCPVVGVIGE